MAPHCRYTDLRRSSRSAKPLRPAVKRLLMHSICNDVSLGRGSRACFVLLAIITVHATAVAVLACVTGDAGDDGICLGTRRARRSRCIVHGSEGSLLGGSDRVTVRLAVVSGRDYGFLAESLVQQLLAVLVHTLATGRCHGRLRCQQQQATVMHEHTSNAAAISILAKSACWHRGRTQRAV